MDEHATTDVIEERNMENADIKSESEEPVKKRQKLDNPKPSLHYNLEERLNGILCCAVCLDLPCQFVYQCSNGHLMCASCLSHVLADARLKDEVATCPNCRCEISKVLCTRNLAVEKAVSELPTACRYCVAQLPRNSIDYHEREECLERETVCRYEQIGCHWRGPSHGKTAHEQNCTHPAKTGAEVMEYLATAEEKRSAEMALYKDIFTLLSYDKVTFSDVQLKPYRTDDFIPKLFYESARFAALNYQWVIKAMVNENQKNPNLSVKRTVHYQLSLKSKTQTPFGVYYLALCGPYGDMKVKPVIYQFEFTGENVDTPFNELPMVDSVECNKQLAAKAINMRVLIFQIQK